MVEKGKEKSASEASRVLDTRRFFFQRLARSQPNFLWHWLVFVKVTLIVMSLQQDCRKKRTTKRLCVTNVTGLLLACFVVILTKYYMCSGLSQKVLFN